MAMLRQPMNKVREEGWISVKRDNSLALGDCSIILLEGPYGIATSPGESRRVPV
jgi:hypothetical protein